MNSDSESKESTIGNINSEEISIKSEILDTETNNITSINSLSEKSKKQYENIYNAFREWQRLNDVNSFSENELLTYFVEIAKKSKSTTLWTHYSILKNTLNINHNINIENYKKLRLLLKQKSVGCEKKKAKIFTHEEIKKFIERANDNKYLATKVAVIMAIEGGCHAYQLHALNVEDVKDLGSAMFVSVPNTKKKGTLEFTLSGHYYEICKKYVDLRPTNILSTSFFLNYFNGKCTAHPIGINKFGSMGKQIAKCLNLPHPEMYTGRSFRKSLIKPPDESILNNIKIESGTLQTQIMRNITISGETPSTSKQTINFVINSPTSINFINCSNIFLKLDKECNMKK